MDRKKGVLAIDFDDVLIETSGRLKKDMFRTLADLGIAPAIAQRAYRDLRTQQFTFASLVRVLFPAPARTQAVHALHSLLIPPRHYTYPGAEHFLKQMKRTHRLILVSYGAPSFQRAKIAQSKLARYFSSLIITNDPTKRPALMKLRRQYGTSLLLLDDSLTVQTTATELGISMIRVKKSRKDAAYYDALARRIGRQQP